MIILIFNWPSNWYKKHPTEKIFDPYLEKIRRNAPVEAREALCPDDVFEEAYCGGGLLLQHSSGTTTNSRHSANCNQKTTVTKPTITINCNKNLKKEYKSSNIMS